MMTMWRKGNEKGSDDNVERRKMRKVVMTMWRKGKQNEKGNDDNVEKRKMRNEVTMKTVFWTIKKILFNYWRCQNQFLFKLHSVLYTVLYTAQCTVHFTLFMVGVGIITLYIVHNLLALKS